MAPGYINYSYKCKEKTFDRLPRKNLQRKGGISNAEIAVSASRRLCESPLFRCRLQDKRLCDEHGQTVSIKLSFLVKDTFPSYLFFYAYDHASTDYSATRKHHISEGRAMRRKRRAETRLVNWITVTIVTYHYDYNIVPPQ